MPVVVKEVVKGVLARLGEPAMHVADRTVDLEQRVADILQRFSEQPAGSAAVVGLHGMGGIGKTTLAKAVFNALHSSFASRSCFLAVGSAADDVKLQQLQQQMLRELCGIERDTGSVDKAGLQRRLQGSPVLLVVDDIWSAEQRDALLVPLEPGSRVLLTTRNAQLLRSPSHPDILSQPVELLGSQAALELFSWCAFLAKEPPAQYSKLAVSAVKACDGLPLTLVVLGAYLCDQPDLQAWEAALSTLQAAQSLTGDRTDKLWGKLRLSYDTLGDAEGDMFLDIACCMLGKRMVRALPAWGRAARIALDNLISRSLVSVDGSGRLKMHDQLRDMGRDIVVKENRRSPALRSRSWMPEALHLAQGEQVCKRPCPTHAHMQSWDW